MLNLETEAQRFERNLVEVREALKNAGCEVGKPLTEEMLNKAATHLGYLDLATLQAAVKNAAKKA